MIFKYFHLGLRQVVMALMGWAIDVPQGLLQSDAKTGPRAVSITCCVASTNMLLRRRMLIIAHFLL